MFGSYRLEPSLRHIVIETDGTVIRLTEKETHLLEYLGRNKQPVAREELLAAIWGYDARIDTHTLETHIYHLRRKLDPEGKQRKRDYCLSRRLSFGRLVEMKRILALLLLVTLIAGCGGGSGAGNHELIGVGMSKTHPDQLMEKRIVLLQPDSGEHLDLIYVRGGHYDPKSHARHQSSVSRSPCRRDRPH